VGAAAVNVAALQRACLPMLVLDVLSVAPRHGYGISQALESAGLQPIRGAQLYPALVRLEDEGAILARWESSESGPARKVYVLTEDGREQRTRLHAQWEAFVQAAASLTGTPSVLR
jgi:PadR family transcriptional regulator PadR